MNRFFVKYFLRLLIIVQPIPAQERAAIDIPRDNYFTIQTATEKVHRKYPDAVAVLDQLPAGVKAIKDVVYNSIGGRDLHTDIFMPKKSEHPLPAVIFIHGGGWRSGDRALQIPMAQRVAAKGFVTFAVEYRLSPEAKYPASIYDLKTLISWIRTNSYLYNIDTNRIAAYGCSSGGHLATLLAATNGLKKFEGKYLDHSSKINAVINVDGVVDLTHPEESKTDKPQNPTSAGKWIGYLLEERPDLWAEASPINYVNSNMPPICFINSSLDEYHVGQNYMIEKMKLFGVYSEVNTVPNSPHTIWLFHPWFEQTFNHLIKFLNEKMF